VFASRIMKWFPAALYLAAASLAAATLPAAAPDSLLVIDEVTGNGNALTRGHHAVVHYQGWLFDATATDRKGVKFDSSLDRGRALSFFYSPGRVIDGWYKGLAGMRVGGKRILVIPPRLGYGNQAVYDIPSNSTLLFEIELLDVVPLQNAQ
jgi:FKBP-type peptidyl-prolyl cis-trans isomerase FkpA